MRSGIFIIKIKFRKMENTENNAAMELMVQSSYDLLHPLVMTTEGAGDIGKWLERDDTNALAISCCLIAGGVVAYVISIFISDIK